jgi:general secretion pathway protein M
VIGQLTRDQERKLAVGILGMVVVLLLALVVVPVWDANADYDMQIDQLRAKLKTLQSRAAADATLRPRYEQLVRSHAASGHHLKSDTEAVAAAELQRIVKTITSKNATQILTTQMLPTAEEQGFIRVALKVRVRGPFEGIVQSIYDIEANQTFLFLDKLSLRDGARRRIRGTIEVNQFDADFDLIAYMRKPM